MENGEKYITLDINIATWLLMNNITLEEVVWGEKQATFIFNDFEDREKLVAKFFKRHELQKWIVSSKEIKTRLYANRPPTVFKKDYDR